MCGAIYLFHSRSYVSALTYHEKKISVWNVYEYEQVYPVHPPGCDSHHNRPPQNEHAKNQSLGG